MNVLITGATGFVGRSLLEQLVTQEKHTVRGAVRKIPQAASADLDFVEVGEIDAATDWNHALLDTDLVIHTAARVHLMSDQAADSLDEYRKVNLDGSLNLARQSVAAGVRRFIFLSSIKVNGEGTLPGRPYSADDSPQPIDDYGISKFEAERELRNLSAASNMELVIIRPPLVYGPGVRANFLSMMRWLSRGIPLPLALVRNKRSFVALDNLIDLIVTCIESPAAANQTFLVSDGEDLSTSELLRAMGQALGKPAQLFPVPVYLLRAAAWLVRKPAIAQRLFDSLQVDISKTCRLLDWSPPTSTARAMKKAADYFLESQVRK